MSHNLSKAMFYVVSAWCVLIGIFNQTISGTQDFEWIAEALEGTDVLRFDPIMAIWAHWIGMFLITAGVALFLLTRVLYDSKVTLGAASVLSVGTISAQLYSALSLGASGPLIVIGVLVLACAIGGPALGFACFSARDN